MAAAAADAGNFAGEVTMDSRTSCPADDAARCVPAAAAAAQKSLSQSAAAVDVGDSVRVQGTAAAVGRTSD